MILSDHLNLPLKYTVLLTLVVIGLHVPAAAQATGKGGAKAVGRQHFENGKSLYAEENYEGAAAEFEASIAAYPTKSGYFNLANCYKALHRYALALEAIRRLRTQFARHLENDPAFQQKVLETERSIWKRVGRLHITSEPLGAVITVDGAEVGRTPLDEPVLVGPGNHIVMAELQGFVPGEKKVSVLSEGETNVDFKLDLKKSQLIVTVSTPNAEVRLDGALVGTSPLTGALLVEPGEHVVDVTLPGYLSDHREFAIAEGEQVLLDVTLVAEQVLPDGERSMSARTLKSLAWVGLGNALALGGASAVLFYFRNRAIDEYDQLNKDFRTANEDEAIEISSKRDKVGTRAQLLHGFGLAAAVTASACAIGALTAAIVATSKRQKKSETKAKIQPGIFSLGVEF